ncbi:MAG: hypothetical protein IPO83_03860 [Chitinophagaceae bacterium]|nr:hypothetical protein [Chitinophagaceae bacterium]
MRTKGLNFRKHSQKKPKQANAITVGLLIDDECFFNNDPLYLGLTAKSNDIMEFYIADALRTLGYKVQIIPFKNSIEILIEDLKAHRYDLVFNMVQHYKNDRKGELFIPAVLDMLGIRYTGPDSAGIFNHE